jgi:hypothetical protein
LLTVFFDQASVVYHGFTQEGQTGNKKYYLQVLQHLCDAVCHKEPEKWSSMDWQICHDNAPVHSSQLMPHFLAKRKIPQGQQPPYSPSLPPCDIFYFPK